MNENLKITGSFDYQACSDVSGQCVTGEEDFDIALVCSVSKVVAKVDKAEAKA